MCYFKLNKYNILKQLFFFISLLVLASHKLSAENTLPLNLSSINKQKILFNNEDDTVKFKPTHAIKLNATQLFLTNLSFQYEFAFHKKLSAAVGYSWLFPRKIPTQIFNVADKSRGFQSTTFSGWALTPEFRYYLGKQKQFKAPTGIYIAPYYRYASYTLKSAYVDKQARTYNVKANYSGYTIGLMIGAQYKINEHFGIDFWIFGKGTGSAKLNILANSSDNNLVLNNQEQEDLKNDITENVNKLGKYGKGKIAIETTQNSADITVKDVPMSSTRAIGLTLGFYF